LVASGADGDHDPDCADVLRVLHDFHAECVATLISSRRDHLLTDWAPIDMSNDSITITVSELDGESLEGVSLWHIIFYTVLELHRREVTSTDPFKFVVS